MNKTKYIIRGTLLLLLVLLLINLYKKTENDLGRIAKFKLETLNKINTDSLGTEHKLDLLVNETTKFNKQLIEDSPQVESALRYLIGIVGLLIAVELGFFISERRRTGE
jgi:hypothetical protein